MKLKYRFLKIFIIVGLLTVMLVFSFKKYNNKLFSGADIYSESIQNVNFIDKNDISQLIYNLSPTNDSIRIKNLNVNKIEKALHKNPYIEKANVFINQRGNVSVQYQQRTPVARINTGEEVFYIDSAGIRMPLSSKFSQKCILINGIIKKEEYKELAKLSTYITMNNLLKNHIKGVNKLSKNSFTLSVNSDSFYIEFGDLKDIENKFSALLNFYSQYLNYKGANVYKCISLKYKNQIVATKK